DAGPRDRAAAPRSRGARPIRHARSSGSPKEGGSVMCRPGSRSWIVAVVLSLLALVGVASAADSKLRVIVIVPFDATALEREEQWMGEGVAQILALGLAQQPSIVQIERARLRSATRGEAWTESSLTQATRTVRADAALFGRPELRGGHVHARGGALGARQSVEGRRAVPRLDAARRVLPGAGQGARRSLPLSAAAALRSGGRGVQQGDRASSLLCRRLRGPRRRQGSEERRRWRHRRLPEGARVQPGQS